jgi:hypothetical protein
MKTIFCDIDGCLIKHQNVYNEEMQLLDGTIEKIKEWDRKGYRLILTTGRRESAREITERNLALVGIAYDQLIMGLGPNVRVLINDLRPEDSSIDTAESYNLVRNHGIKNLDI